MESSTPNNPQSSTHRKSFLPPRPSITPLRRREDVSGLEHLPEVDDAAERAERRRSALIRKSLQASNTGSAIAVDLDGSVNESVKGLSQNDLKNQLQVFFRLNAQNKISVKNAWTIRVIDILKQAVNKNMPDVFNLATNTLEIAGRVYGFRVDDVHTDIMRLMHTLARKHLEANNEPDDDGNASPSDEITPAGSTPAGQKKKEKKKRPFMVGETKRTVNTNVKTFVAPLSKLQSTRFSIKEDRSLSAIQNLLTNKVRMDPSGTQFMFGRKEKGWGWKTGNDSAVNSDNFQEKFPIKLKSIKNYLLCAPFKDFVVDRWDQDADDSLRPITQLDEVVLDDDGIPIPELDGSIHDVFEENAGESGDEAFHATDRGLEYRVDFRPTEDAASVFDGEGTFEQIYAGPSHWKHKLIKSKPLIFSGTDEKKKTEIKKKPKKNHDVPLDLFALCMGTPNDLNQMPSTKKKPQRKNVLLDSKKLYLPQQCSAAKKMIENIFNFSLIPTKRYTKKDPPKKVADLNVTGYNYDNPNDSNYCPALSVQDDNDDPDEASGIVSPADIASCAPVAFTGENLVDAPTMVPQYQLNYATRAKKMDMKKLKQAVWCTLTNQTEYEATAQVTPTKFSSMYKNLPHHLTEKMKAELTCPLAFSALLQLCNEHNLELQKGIDNADFGINGPLCPCN